jgi:putative FmdB family regulatory protein
MPIYEYECSKCGKQFEVFQRISDKPLNSCQFCKGKVHRLISQTSFSLKGGGWYQDGYSKAPPAKGKQASEVGTGKTEAKAGEGKAAKEAPKKESKKETKKAS